MVKTYSLATRSNVEHTYNKVEGIPLMTLQHAEQLAKQSREMGFDTVVINTESF